MIKKGLCVVTIEQSPHTYNKTMIQADYTIISKDAVKFVEFFENYKKIRTFSFTNK